MNNITKDDLVLVIDNSGALEITKEGILFRYAIPGKCFFNLSPVFRVIWTGNNILPAKQDWMIYETKRYNNTIIEEYPEGRTFLTKKEYLIKANSEEGKNYIVNHKNKVKDYERTQKTIRKLERYKFEIGV